MTLKRIDFVGIGKEASLQEPLRNIAARFDLLIS